MPLLSTRTKQVTTYGRRSRNIVSVYDRDSPVRVQSQRPPPIPQQSRPSPIEPDIYDPPPLPINTTPVKEKKPKSKRIKALVVDDISPPIRRLGQQGRRFKIPDSPVIDVSTPVKSNFQLNSSARNVTPKRPPLSHKPANLFGSPAPLLLGRKPTEKKKRVHKPSGSGLAPSPPQKSAPQHVDIITLDSDGEEIAVERRVRNPKAHQPKAPIKTAIDSVISLDSDDDGPTEQKFPVTNKPKLAAKTPTKPKKVLELPLSKDGTRGQGLRTAQNAERDMPWNAPRDLIKPIDPVGDLPAPSQPQKTVTAPKTVRRSANHPPASTPSNHIGASFLSLPPQILEAIQKTGDLSVALPYLSPKSRSALETILCAEKLTRGKQKSETHQRDTPPTPSTLGDLDLEEEEFAQAFESLSLSPSPLKKRTTKAIDGLEERVPLQQTSRSASAAVQTHPNAPIASTSASLTALPLPSPCLARLLEISKQAEPYDFSSFVETFPFDPIHGEAAGQVIFRKIGEASFSEVFGIGNVVLKIVPITVTKDGKTFDSIEEGQMLPDVSDVADVLKEVIMTKAMGEIHPGFIRLLGTYIVKGAYPEHLLRLWDDFDEWKGSQSLRPHGFRNSQHFALILLPHAGCDLEARDFALTSKTHGTAWRQCASVFWQVCKALSVAEEDAGFEHRDLHWGQILIKDIEVPKQLNRGPKTPVRICMDHAAHGVKATIIDLGLSRMNPMDGEEIPRYSNFDETIFQGEGDYQFDIYRMMREHNGNSWADFRPLTNVMWLHYLVQKLLHRFDLKKPVSLAPTSRKGRPSKHIDLDSTGPVIFGYGEKECWDCLVEVEKLMAKALSTKPIRSTRSKSRNLGASAAFSSARDVLRWGRGHDWVD